MSKLSCLIKSNEIFITEVVGNEMRDIYTAKLVFSSEIMPQGGGWKVISVATHCC